MSLAACISRWPTTTRRPWFGVLAPADEPLEHRGLRLLRLQEQRILVVAADEEMDPGACSDAPDADHLARGVDVFELLDRVVLAGERAPVAADQRAHQSVELLGRRFRRTARSSIGTISGGSATMLQLAVRSRPARFEKHADVVAGPRLRDVLLRPLRLLLAETLLAAPRRGRSP